MNRTVGTAISCAISFLAQLTMTAGFAQTCGSAPTGLVSWWRGEGSAFDQVSGNDGRLVGEVAFGAGKVEQGLAFDGNGDGVRVGNPENLRLQDFTIEAWIRRNSSAQVSIGSEGGYIFGYGGGGYAFYLGGNARLYLAKIGTIARPGNATISDTNFHHVAVTKSGSAVQFYVDGSVDAVTSWGDAFEFDTEAAIGAQPENLSSSFLGVIDELSVYDRALTGAQIQALYTAGTSGK